MAFLPFFGRNFSGSFWELEKMRSHMDHVYNALADGFNQIRRNYTGVFPLVNISEDEDNLFLTAELPGLTADRLEISIKGETLTLKGAKTQDNAGDETLNYHRRERQAGSFSRSLTLPVKVKSEDVGAVFKNGILTVTLPKATEARAHQITVQAQ
ncbi:MAG: Hsp20/alpha crystallin family protein [Deltaproteobacteria bacterium]|jgi:HSP20 family protein|nr:Hsp20/alpha crystallin family protein [Deltaproteobacteria bacterium]